MGNFRRLYTVATQLQAGERATAYRRSLLFDPSIPLPTEYELLQGDIDVAGKLYMLNCPPTPPFSSNLRRFIAFVPAHYSQSGSTGHFAWLHYTPVWGPDRANAPRFREAHQNYPDGLWTDYYVADYLFGHRVLASFAEARINAILFLPVHRFTVSNALEPLSNLRNLMVALSQMLICLEGIEPRLRANDPRLAGSVEGIGVSCFSFGAEYCSRLFARQGVPADIYSKLRAGAYLDGVTSLAQRTCREIVGGTPRRVSGWLAAPPMPQPAAHYPRRISFFQQPSISPRDFVGPFRAALGLPWLTVGETVNTSAAPPLNSNELYFHRVDCQQMICVSHEGQCRDPRHNYNYWHGRIHQLFLWLGLVLARDCFLW
ncbi:MAG TPA: hypothetical protein VF779_01655 [Pyrinomonadaceae bacterium]